MRPLKATLFRQYYDRADLPVSMLHRAGGNRLKWHVKPLDLDYHAYLPLFFDGLCEVRGLLGRQRTAAAQARPIHPTLIPPSSDPATGRRPIPLHGHAGYPGSHRGERAP